MDTLYLLLRSNRQIGPHRAEELARLHLQSSDLIWIEGKSTAWSYPHEIEALRHYLTYLTTPVSADESIQKQHEAYLPQPAKSQVSNKNERHIYVSMPEKTAVSSPVKAASAADQTLEAKAEALRQKVQAYETSAARSPLYQEQPSDDIEPPHQSLEERYATQAVARRVNENKKALLYRKVAAAAAIVVVIGGGFLMARDKMNRPATPPENSSVVQQVPATKEPAIENTPEPLPENQPVTEAVVPVTDYNTPVKTTEKTIAVKHTAVPVREPVVIATVSNNKQPQPEAERPVKKEETKPEAQPVEAATAEAPVKEKGSLAHKLNRFFDKFKSKKEDAPVPEEKATSKTEESNNGERRSSRRGEEATAPAKTDLTQMIDISSNEAASDNFMAGVHGLELTVRNRSSEPVTGGAVEVRYYNDNKELIDKRTVNFNNIAPNKKIVVRAPDHRLADHTDYRLIAVR